MATEDQIALLTDQLAALKRARGSGVLEVRHGDTSTTYRSVSEILAAITQTQAELDKLNGVKRGGPRYIRESSRGL